MVIDSSVLVAILFEESDADALTEAIENASPRLLSAASLLECSMVIEARKGVEGARDLDLFIYRAQIEIVAVDPQQAEVARVAWRRFGKGNHPAGLNYGDLFSYALAKVTGSPLLYKGGDFSRTDLG
ncbi:MAG: type II toxin-antitoxin system VapC family toxin [Caulobacterales bacterium]